MKKDLPGGTPQSTRSSEPAPRGCSSQKLRQLSRRTSQHFDRMIAATGLKTTQYSLLSNIVQLGPIRPGELAERMEMDASTLTRNLQPLVSRGWVEVGAGSDARSRFVTATESGRAKRASAQRSWKRAQLAFNERLGEDRVLRLHALIAECLTALGQGQEGSETRSTRPCRVDHNTDQKTDLADGVERR